MLFGRLPPADGGFFAPMNFDFLKRDAAALLVQPGLASQAKWGDRAFMGTRSVLKRQDAATLSGDLAKYDFSLLVPASEIDRLGGIPAPLKDTIELDGTRHLVLSVEKDVAGNVRLHLGSQYG